MLARRINKNFLTKRTDWRCYSASLQPEEEYTSTPQYPPILNTSPEARLERKKEAVHEEIKNVKTVEEKQIKLNMPKYYGFKCYILNENFAPYNSLPMIQHVTRTHLIESNKLPMYYKDVAVDVDNLLESITADVEELILTEYDGYIRSHFVKKEELTKAQLEDNFSKSLCAKLNRIFLNALHESNPHLKSIQVDFDPRIEACWFVGGMNPPENIKRYRRAEEFRKHTENDPTNRAILAFASPSLTLRADQPLNPIVPYNEADNPDFHVPYFQYDPRVLGTTTEHRRITNIPGFWPGETHQFGLLSYHQRGHMLDRNYKDDVENKEALHRQGILSSFAWLNAQANFLGFTTFNDITYPLITQTCVTNGQLWSFYTYQLNTMLIHSKHVKENPKKNICWATQEMKLFEDIQDNKVLGLNKDVLKTLLKYYLNKPKQRLGVNMRPYLGSHEKYIADYADDEKRRWLEREYKFLVSNRPRFKLDYEVYNWEKIYKIDHKTRPMDKRRRPFELFIKPSDRRLDDRQAFYIPKAQRPDVPKKVGRYAKEYFP